MAGRHLELGTSFPAAFPAQDELADHGQDERTFTGNHGARIPHMAHQAGLVRLKGGLENIQIPGAASAIFYRTLVNSTLTLSQPEIPFYSVHGHGTSDIRSYFDSGSGQFEADLQLFRDHGRSDL
ncbi:hypothetical protein BJX70DRAFT_401364 [Aspergillus crustosus]